ncbi:Glycogen accumulation regulator GarA [Luteitalea pratensis]|uniref:Glycogen accumulation regulator GarA n=1 Tax=Luteitalea pratensis TaxID=1855912 RepID=A0A143PHH2_LUTPR|nr:FHA domain-containing protein [Luteitalea pratensis]AMY07199.1 Glycogen accumulation regulator GarA [Luteitalea pratensis]
MPKVIIWRDGAIETEFDPGHRDWRMGRSETNDITLLDPRKSVSRFHAELREENGRWVFIDLNSQNGSWKDGQRVNRLVLEHGHEVLFGDYKMAFQDVKVAAPPPPPPRRGAALVATDDVPIAPDQTLLVPGKAQPPGHIERSTADGAGAAVSSATPASPAPLPPGRLKAKPLRKGVNPVILVLFLVAMLGAVAAVAWKVLSSGTEERPVVQAETPAAPPAQTPAAAPPPVAPPPVDVPPALPPPGVAVTQGQTPATTPAPPPTSPTPGSKAGPEVAPPRPKRVPPPPPKDNPAIVVRYDEGRRAIRAGHFIEAERAFQAVLQMQPGFRDTQTLLAQARDGQSTARQKSLADGRAFEASGDWTRAIAAYERAGAADMASAARSKMTVAGDDAYRKARQFDARNRPIEAMTWYQRAVQWLPDSDARKATAQERLAALKGGGA